MKKIWIISTVVLVVLFLNNFYTPSSVYADVSCDSQACLDKPDDQKEACLSDQIKACSASLQSAQNQEKTLNSQLKVIDGQTQVTKLKVAETNYKIDKLKREITDLDTRIDRIGASLDTLSEILLRRIVQTYKYSDTVEALDLIFSSKNFTDLLSSLKYIQVAQAYDKKKLYELQATKLAYHDQKEDKVTRQAEAEKLNKDLAVYQKQLDDQKNQKQALLSQTQGDEATYKKLLAQAQTQLAGFSSFAANQGGASILTNQTVCDDWGCYYNQRDSQWGNIALNNTQYSIASDGCLLTSVAMVYTHYGHKDVTPISVNSNPSNFAAYYPAYLLYTVNVNGVNSNRVRAIIDSTLSGGDPVIVGIRYSSGDTHFVVLTSGSNGNYMMNDPFIPNGHQISFSSHYSVGSIYEIDKVTF